MDCCVTARIFPQCVNDVVLRGDFLSNYGAALDCWKQEVIFPFADSPLLPVALPDYEMFHYKAALICRHDITPRSTKYVHVQFSPPIPDGSTVILSPNDACSQDKRFMIPHVVTTVSNNCAVTNVTNLMYGHRVLPRHSQIVNVEFITRNTESNGIFSVSLSDEKLESCNLQDSSQARMNPLSDELLDKMIDNDLSCTDEREQVKTLLRKFSSSFD